MKKYKVAPPVLPDHLAWFKWEAYTTWLSGFALMVVLYYFNANAYLIDPSVADLSSWEAVGISIALLVVAWVVYDVLCRLLLPRGRNGEIVLWALIIAADDARRLGLRRSCSSRAPRSSRSAPCSARSWPANVFFNIIPAHWELINAKKAGREPDPTPGIVAKQRSVHNNYFTLPVLFTMLAGHFAFVYGAGRAWLVLIAIMLLGVLCPGVLQPAPPGPHDLGAAGARRRRRAPARGRDQAGRRRQRQRARRRSRSRRWRR